MGEPWFKPVADHAVLIELATEISEEANTAVQALDEAIAGAAIAGVSEVVPALVNLLVIFDPLVTDHKAIEAAVRALLPIPDRAVSAGQTHDISVCYEDGFCPDLAAVAAQSGMTTAAVINAHVGGRYRVGMYGFAPGYAYLAGVPDAIQVPRKTAAVRDIPAGSVMIAGPQCLITTLVMPTGWSIIGRSPDQVMTDDPERPFLFAVGDVVTFTRISTDALGRRMS